MQGTEDGGNNQTQLLVKHMLKPFKHRRKHMIPSYDAVKYRPSNFPVLSHTGPEGPEMFNMGLLRWTKYVLSVEYSQFARDLDFIFFLKSVDRRKRLSGLAANAPIRSKSTRALLEIREALEEDCTYEELTSPIDYLLRSGVLNASFENLKVSPVFWADLKSTCWA